MQELSSAFSIRTNRNRILRKMDKSLHSVLCCRLQTPPAGGLLRSALVCSSHCMKGNVGNHLRVSSCHLWPLPLAQAPVDAEGDSQISRGYQSRLTRQRPSRNAPHQFRFIFVPVGALLRVSRWRINGVPLRPRILRPHFRRRCEGVELCF